MIRDFFIAVNFKLTVYISVLWLVCLCISCNSSTKPQKFEENIAPFIQNAYLIKDSASIPAAFRYIDSVALHIPIADMDYYPIYTFKHNCYLNDLQNADSALVYADSMLAVIRRNADFDWNDYKLVDASFAKADAYYMKGNYREAYAWYSKNKTKYSDGDPCIGGAYNFRIAMSLYKEERFEESSEYFITSFSQQQHCDTTLPQLIRMQEILSNTGLCYFNLKKYDSAVYYYNKALKYIDLYTGIYPDKTKQWLGAKAVIYGNIGKLLAANKQNDSAKIYFKQSIAIDDSFSVNVSDMLTVRLALAKLYLTGEKDDSAKLMLDVIGQYIEKYNLPEVKSNYYNLLWHYYYMTGNEKAALETLVDYTLAKDSSFFKQKKALINDLSEGIHESEAMYEKELYQQDRKISRITIIALVSVSVATLFIIIWLVRVVFKRKRTINEQVQIMEEIAWLQSHEMRKPVATMKGLLHVYNHDDVTDPNNAFIIRSMEEQLDDMDTMINDINNKLSPKK